MDLIIEFIGRGKGLMGKEIGFEVAPTVLDVIEFGGVLAFTPRTSPISPLARRSSDNKMPRARSASPRAGERANSRTARRCSGVADKSVRLATFILHHVLRDGEVYHMLMGFENPA